MSERSKRETAKIYGAGEAGCFLRRFRITIPAAWQAVRVWQGPSGPSVLGPRPRGDVKQSAWFLVPTRGFYCAVIALFLPGGNKRGRSDIAI